jgi:DNA-binding transcriptional MerR regulator
MDAMTRPDSPRPETPARADAPAAGESAAAYTIDELAAASRVPSRTIRFYQSRGALMPPEIRGRVAYYGDAHLERLKLIAQLQDRGLRIDAIGDLMKRIDKGEVDLAEWLGVEEQLHAPWIHDQPRSLTEAELYELAGERRPGLIAELLRAEIVERRGDVYLVGSPALLAIAMRLEAAGVDLDTAAGAASILRKHIGRAVADLVDYFVDRAKDGHLQVGDPRKLFEAFRSCGIESVRLLFAREMERALRKLLASGKMATFSTRPRKERRR